MDLYDFVTQKEIETIAERIKNKLDFDIENKYKSHEIWIIGGSK